MKNSTQNQERTAEGKNLCPYCQKVILYPQGVYCKGIEFHVECVQTIRKGKQTIK